MGDREIECYPFRGGQLRNGFAILEIPGPKSVFELAVRLDVESARLDPKNFSYETSKDLRLSALVSMVKSAHLSMFSLQGYRYACLSTGMFVGKDILGKFFLENQHCPKAQVLKNALTYFREFQHMVRPLDGELAHLQGTLSDGRFLFCADSTGFPWGLVVFVKTADKRSAVLLPANTDGDAVFTYLSFLRNDRSSVYFMDGIFDSEKKAWRVDPTRKLGAWAKSANSYPTKT